VLLGRKQEVVVILDCGRHDKGWFQHGILRAMDTKVTPKSNTASSSLRQFKKNPKCL
jgi:hypothetical protein